MKLQILRNTGWGTIGNCAYAGAQWLLLVVLAKRSAAIELGTYAFALAVAGPMFTVAQANLRIAHAVGDGDLSVSPYAGFRHVTQFLAAIITVLFCLLIAGQKAALVALVLSLARSQEGGSDIIHGAVQRDGKYELVGKSLATRASLQLAVGGAAALAFGTALSTAIGVLIGAVITYYLFDRGLYPRFAASFDRRQLLGIARIALPFGSIALFGSLYQNIPRYFLAEYRGVEEVGVFSGVFYLTFVGFTIVAALSNSVIRDLAVSYQSDFPRFRAHSYKYIGIAVAIGVAMLAAARLAGDRLLPFVYDADFRGRTSLLLILMAGSIAWYAATAASFVLIAARRAGQQAAFHVLTAVAVAVLSWILVPGRGAEGAGIALGVGVTVLAVLNCASVLLIRPARQPDTSSAGADGWILGTAQS